VVPQFVVLIVLLLREIAYLLEKDFRLEWRQRAALGGLLLYVGGTVFVCYLSFSFRGGNPPAPAWNALFWIIMLFASISAAGRGLAQETAGQRLYYYTLVRPQAVIWPRCCTTPCCYCFWPCRPCCSTPPCWATPCRTGPCLPPMCCWRAGPGQHLTLVGGIAARAAAGNGTLLAVLGFPVLIPLLLVLVKVSKNALDGLTSALAATRS
jgi:heme exporter protein B